MQVKGIVSFDPDQNRQNDNLLGGKADLPKGFHMHFAQAIVKRPCVVAPLVCFDRQGIIPCVLCLSIVKSLSVAGVSLSQCNTSDGRMLHPSCHSMRIVNKQPVPFQGKWKSYFLR
jgi:hypothetical protein